MAIHPMLRLNVLYICVGLGNVVVEVKSHHLMGSWQELNIALL